MPAFVWRLAVVLLVLSSASSGTDTTVGGPVHAAARQTPASVFRAGVDLIPVDVQVVDGTGRPVSGLTADRFEVTINGRRRRVVSAELIDYRVTLVPAGTSGPSGAATKTTEGLLADPARAAPTRRIIVLAIDCSSFDEATGRPALIAAAEYVRRLRPDDEVGVFAYPIGPKVDPTTDHDAVIRALEAVVARHDLPPAGEFNLSASDLVEVSREPQTPQGEKIVEQMCGVPPDQDLVCVARLRDEVRGKVVVYEGLAQYGIGTLRQLMAELGKVPERKTLVLVSGGIVSADIPGARPDNHALGVEAGRAAARANVSVYTLFLDQAWMKQTSAESRRALSSVQPARDSAIIGRWLDEFSGTAGGSFTRVVAGNGSRAFDRILSETSAYYLLGVEPAAADRDGRPHEMRVKVAERNVHVRGRSWVVVPKPGAVPAPSANAAVVPGAPARTPTPTPVAAPLPPILPPTPPAVRAVAEAFDRDDRVAIAAALAPRNANALIQAFRESETPWPSSARRTAAFALDLALTGLRAESPFTKEEALRLLAEYTVRIRQPAPNDVFECTWLWAASAGLEGLFAPELSLVLVARALERCPRDPSLLLALAVVSDQQLVLGGAGLPASAAGPGDPSDRGQRVLDRYAAAAAFPEARYEARVRAAFLHFRAGRHRDGLAELDAAGQPSDDPQVRYLGSLARGQLLAGLGQWDEAVTALREALVIWPRAQSARVALLSVYAQRGQSVEAAELSDSVLGASADDGDPWWLYYLGDYRLYPLVRARLRQMSP